jgi:hypothetical protein
MKIMKYIWIKHINNYNTTNAGHTESKGKVELLYFVPFSIFMYRIFRIVSVIGSLIILNKEDSNIREIWLGLVRKWGKLGNFKRTNGHATFILRRTSAEQKKKKKLNVTYTKCLMLFARELTKS